MDGVRNEVRPCTYIVSIFRYYCSAHHCVVSSVSSGRVTWDCRDMTWSFLFSVELYVSSDDN